MANKTVTVRPSGGTYTTLQAAITGEVAANADLVSMAGILTISIEGSWSSADSTAVTVSGFTTSSSYYVNIVADASNKAGTSFSSSKYRLEVSRPGSQPIIISQDYTRIVGLQVKNTSGTGSRVIRTNNIAFIDSCFMYDSVCSIAAINLTSGSVVSNSIIKSITGIGVSGVGSVYSSTIATCSTYGCSGTSTLVLKNCYIGNCGTADYYSAPTLTNCYSEDGSVSTSTAAYSTDTFTNVTAGSEDFAIPSGSGLVGAGADLRADATWPITVDILGTTRAATPCVGAFEYVATGVSGTIATDQKKQSTTISGTMSLSGTVTANQKKQTVNISSATANYCSISINQKDQSIVLNGVMAIDGTITIVQKKQSSSIGEISFIPITLTLSALYDEDMILDAQYIESITLTPQEDIP